MSKRKLNVLNKLLQAGGEIMNMKLKASVVLLSLASLWSLNASAAGTITVSGSVTPEPCVPVVSVLLNGGTVSGEDVDIKYDTVSANTFDDNGAINKTIVYQFPGCELDSVGLQLTGTQDTIDSNAWALTGTTNLAMYTYDADNPATAITPTNNSISINPKEVSEIALLLSLKTRDGTAARAGDFEGLINTVIFEG